MNLNFFAITILIIIGLFILLAFKQASDRRWAKAPIHNFSFRYKGKKYWFSRTVGISHAVFAKNEDGNWCVLAKKRGHGNHTFPHLWTLPCVYIEFNQTGEQAAQKETYESANVFIRIKDIIFFKALTSPSVNKQNVELQYYTIVEGRGVEVMTPILAHTEKKITEEVKWISLDTIQHYNWAFNHDEVILDMIKTLKITAPKNIE